MSSGIFNFIRTPSEWRRMSGPLAFTTALVAGVIGLLLCAVGGGSLTTAESPSSRLTALALLALGLFALGSVVLGVIAFFRANRERG
jgi:hypothetical protein